MVRPLHFSGWNFSNQVLLQFSRFSKSSCKISLSSPSIMFLKILVSSANRYTSDFIPSGKSLMNSMNNEGPNTEPYDIPDVTSFQSDVDPLIDTFCVLPVRKSSIHSNNGLSNM